MTMATEPADVNALDDVFGSDRGDRYGNEPPASEPAANSGLSRDERGRFAPKTPDQPVESQPAPVETQEPPAATEAAPVDPNASRHVPLSEHLSERKKYKAREEELTRLHLEAEARAKAYEQAFRQQPQRQPEPEAQPPDPYTDPEGAFRYQQEQTQKIILSNKLDLSESFARRHYGSPIVDEAFKAAEEAGAMGNFLRAQDPYGELVEWHKRQKALAKIGPDPEAYEKQLEEKIRQKVLQELKAGSGQPQPSFPGTLANATATGTQGAHLSPEAAMGSVFASGRDRRHG